MYYWTANGQQWFKTHVLEITLTNYSISYLTPQFVSHVNTDTTFESYSYFQVFLALTLLLHSKNICVTLSPIKISIHFFKFLLLLRYSYSLHLEISYLNSIVKYHVKKWLICVYW